MSSEICSDASYSVVFWETVDKKNVCTEDLGLLHTLACSVGKCQESRLPSIWKTTSCLMISFKGFITRGVRAQQTLLGQSQHTWSLHQDRPALPLPPFHSLSAHLPLEQVRIGFSPPQELRGDRREWPTGDKHLSLGHVCSERADGLFPGGQSLGVHQNRDPRDWCFHLCKRLACPVALKPWILRGAELLLLRPDL